MNFTLDKTSGYMYAYNPTHELANGAGKVYEHIYVMVKHINRKLLPNECVHHIDRNRSNNHLDNLILLNNVEHTQLHWLEKSYLTEGFIKNKQILYEHIHLLENRYVEKECQTCKQLFKTERISTQIFCSRKCFDLNKRKFEITKEELEFLVWNYPTMEVAKKLGISDVAVAKRCKLLGIPKPPRGYWNKKKANKI